MADLESSAHACESVPQSTGGTQQSFADTTASGEEDRIPFGDFQVGRIKFFDRARGFGFIIPDDGGPDVYLRGTRVEAAESIERGTIVRFTVGEFSGRREASTCLSVEAPAPNVTFAALQPTLEARLCSPETFLDVVEEANIAVDLSEGTAGTQAKLLSEALSILTPRGLSIRTARSRSARPRHF